MKNQKTTKDSQNKSPQNNHLQNNGSQDNDSQNNDSQNNDSQNNESQNNGSQDNESQSVDPGNVDPGNVDPGNVKPGNVDPAEVEKFNKLARKWWDKNSEFKPLHDINPLRMDYISQCIKVENLEVLDVGCGGGILSESLAQAGARVTAIDTAEMPLKIAKLHALENNVKVDYQQITIEEFAAATDKKFDLITCMEMLEHVPDPDSVIKSCGELLKPEGQLFLSTINRNLKAYMLAIVGAEYILKLLPKGTHEYEKLIKPSELARSLRRYDFETKDISGMTYNPITKKYKISRDTDVNYLIHAVAGP